MSAAIAIPAYALVLGGVLLLGVLGLAGALLRRRRDAYQALDTFFDASDQALLLLDRAGNIIRANGAALALLRTGPDGLQGVLFRSLLADPELAKEDPWDFARTPERRLSCALRSPADQSCCNVLADFRTLRYGVRESLLVAVSDLSAIQRLHSCQARLSVMHENASQGIAVLQQGVFVYANTLFERICGRSLAQLGEQAAQDVFHSEDRAYAWGELTQSARCEEASRCFPCRLRRPDGADVWVRVAAICMQWEEHPALFCFFADVSAQHTLAVLQRDLRHLAAADTRTPLESVIGLPRRVVQEGGLSPRQEQRLRAVDQAGYALLRTLHHSLDAHRMASGAYALAPGPVDLLALLERVREDLELLGGRGDSGCSVTLDGRQPRAGERVLALGEELLCYTLLHDCLEEALRTVRPGSPVACALARRADGAAVEFSYRTREGAAPQTPVAARIAALHQGALDLRLSKGGKAMLSLRLPLFQDAADAEVLASGGCIAPWPRIRLLFAATDAAQRAACKAQLAGLPFRIDMAGDGAEALALFRKGGYDVVCMDMRMPDGPGAVQQIRSWEQGLEQRSEDHGRVRVPIVALLSPNGDPSDRSYFEVGCQAVLPLPFDARPFLLLLDRFHSPGRTLSSSHA